MEFYIGHLLYPHKEPLFEVDDKWLTEAEARIALKQQYGNQIRSIDWLNVTTYNDNSDRFIMGLFERVGESG